MKFIIFIFIILISFNLFSVKKSFLKTYCEKVFLDIEKESNHLFPKKLLSKFTDKIEYIFPFEKKDVLLKALKTDIQISDIQDYAEYEPETKTLFFRPDVVKSIFFPLIYSHELRHVIDEMTGKIKLTSRFSFFKKIFNLKVESTLNPQEIIKTELRAFLTQFLVLKHVYTQKDLDSNTDTLDSTKTLILIYKKYFNDPYGFVFVLSRFHPAVNHLSFEELDSIITTELRLKRNKTFDDYADDKNEILLKQNKLQKKSMFHVDKNFVFRNNVMVLLS